MKNIIKRSKSVLILLLILIPLIFITYYGQFVGKIIGFSFYLSISTWATYEVIKHTNFKEISKIFIILASLSIWVFPLNLFTSDLFFNDLTGYPIEFTKISLNFVMYPIDFGKFAYFNVILAFIFLTIAYFMSFGKVTWKDFLIASFSAIFISWFFKILFVINIANFYYLIALELIVAAVDTFGYFGGYFLGHKFIKQNLMPKTSPNKTYEGAFFSLFFGLIVTFLAGYLGYLTHNSFATMFTNTPQIVLAVLLLSPFAIFGDWLFSKIKRYFGIKDYSNLIPGHGGIMDRLDSLSFVTIIWTILFIYV
ncbi:phosphatidate cytidylyltransferase [Mycoplasma zalophi]|uniref:Phosphatidate cytidylyltransferase n=1 Tax=Mycoplasma zalophi TaxID=191287 RepID=A0ABS6DPS6_9MOLU|nr:phosphatidate cytidylyltransferase [Mycoplasma zalophi]MBU4691054.1 phosphatidate cytidylyltransferase [Mycoplasma zalophi]MBU4692166.1 phosphatidate cytidylyltransferase [Mycoplasma zalophi]